MTVEVYYRPLAPEGRRWEVRGPMGTCYAASYKAAAALAQELLKREAAREAQPPEPGPGRRVRHG